MKASLLNPLPQATAEAFNPSSADYWEKQTPDELTNHIISVHLDPYLMRLFGVPNFDLEVAQARGFSHQNLANQIIDMLEQGLSNFYQYNGPLTTTSISSDGAIGDHTIKLIKTLDYIDELQPGTVNWKRIRLINPDLLRIDFNYQTDCSDASFAQQLAVRQQLAKALHDSIASLFQS